MASSMNCSSPLCLKSLSLLPMLSVCTCTEVPSRSCSAMKTKNRTLIAGSRILLLDKSSGKFSLNGCGISVWNWAIASIRQLCVQPSLLRLKSLLLLLYQFLILLHQFLILLHQFLILLHLSCTGRQSGREPHAWGSLLAWILLNSPMARCIALLAIHSMPRSGEWSRMAPCALSMLLALRIVVGVHCKNSASCMEKTARTLVA